MMPSRTTLDIRIYRASLGLFPPAFQRDFSDDMLRDFEDDLNDVLQEGRAVSLWSFRARMLRDVTRTLGVQWLRTGWPMIIVLAMAFTLTFMSVLAQVFLNVVIQLPSGSSDQDVIALEMLTVVVLLFIVATILLTMWSGRIVRRGTRRRIRI
jgi:hypothetical protein